jgi:hypothetical protein
MEERWVKVAAAPDESVALLMDGVLKDAGIPSLIQRAAHFDAPDFLSGSPRCVLVQGSLAEEARQVLEDTRGSGRAHRSGAAVAYRHPRTQYLRC